MFPFFFKTPAISSIFSFLNLALGLGLVVACLSLLSALGGEPEEGDGEGGLKDDPPWPPNPLVHDPLAFEDFKGEGDGEAFATEAEELEESARSSQVGSWDQVL